MLQAPHRRSDSSASSQPPGMPRRQAAVRWAAAPVAVVRDRRTHGVEEPPQRWGDDQVRDGPTPRKRGSVAARRTEGHAGGGPHCVVRDVNEFSELQLDLAAMPEGRVHQKAEQE